MVTKNLGTITIMLAGYKATLEKEKDYYFGVIQDIPDTISFEAERFEDIQFMFASAIADYKKILRDQA